MPTKRFAIRPVLISLVLLACLWLAPAASFGLEAGPAGIIWRAEKGTLSGEFENRPLSEVLSSLQPYSRFSFRGPEDILSLPVSGRFHKAAPTQVVKKILKRFNHTLLENDAGAIQQLIVMSLRDESGAGSEVLVPSPKSIQQEAIQAREKFRPKPEPSEEARRAILEGAAREQELPEDIEKAFHPEQEPGTEKTGPKVPTGTKSRPLPKFTPKPSETGPGNP